MEIVLNQKIYKKTEDENIIDCYQLFKDEVRLSDLEKEVADLEILIAGIPDEVEYPREVTDEVKKAIDFHNQVFVADGKRKGELEERLNKTRDLLTALRDL